MPGWQQAVSYQHLPVISGCKSRHLRQGDDVPAAVPYKGWLRREQALFDNWRAMTELGSAGSVEASPSPQMTSSAMPKAVVMSWPPCCDPAVRIHVQRCRASFHDKAYGCRHWTVLGWGVPSSCPGWRRPWHA